MLDIDKDEIPEKVRKVPTILIYFDGGKIKTLTGYRATDSILSFIDKHRGA